MSTEQSSSPRPSSGMAHGRPRPRRAGWRRLIPSWKAAIAMFVVGVLVVVAGFTIAYNTTPIPDPNAQAQAQKTTVYYSDGRTELGSFALANRTNIPIAQMPKAMQQALVASEDRTFYTNRGVSIRGTVRAFWNNLRGGSQQGGSTITQQYVKNYYLNSSKSYLRKVKEALIAVKLDNQLSKDEIMQNYLNTVFFGRGAYGVQAAAETFWDIPASKLSVAQSALLVAILPSPSRYDPARNPKIAQERWNTVLDLMVQQGYLTAEQRAKQVFPKTPMRKNTNDFAGPNGYLLQAVRDELVAAGLDEDLIDSGGLKIVSSFDVKMQKAAVDAMNNTSVYPSSRPKTLLSALTSIDPATGSVRAMYGGADYLKRQRNAATQDVAQAGSTFKPFTLLTALEKGYSLNSTFSGANGRVFPDYPRGVKNFGGSNYGYINLLRATANSVNTVYVDLNNQVGPQNSMDTAISAGMPKDTAGLKPYLSNVLGAASPHNIDMAHAFSTFAARGVRHTPHVVEKVTGPDPATKKQKTFYTGPTQGEKVFETGPVDDLNYALRQVVVAGSGSYAANLGRQVAGKTGTSTSAMSAWFVGFTPQLVTAVSLYNTDAKGNPQPIPPFGGVGSITGGSFPCRIWTAYMKDALRDAPYLQFEPPVWGGEFKGTRAPQTSTWTPTASPSSSSPTSSAPTTSAPTGQPTSQPPTSAPATPAPASPSPAPTVTGNNAPNPTSTAGATGAATPPVPTARSSG